LAKQTINIGAAANDGTGDPIRDAFDKVNDNFDEIYSSYVAAGAITVGNSTVNSVVSNTGGLVVSNSTVSTVANSSIFKIGNTTANATLTSTRLDILGNTTIGSGSVNTSTMAVGNSTVNSSLSQSTLTISTPTSSLSVNSSVIFIGNSTSNAVANTTRLTISSADVSSNTLSLGSGSTGSSVGTSNFANGFTRLPNGLLYQWGYIAAVNSTANVTTFASVGGVAFTNLFSVSATTNNTANHIAVVAANSTAIVLQSNVSTNTGVYWTVIGK
jgi:hypothetical protein